MEIVLSILLLIILLFLIYKNKKNIKPTAQKKYELINSYKKELEDILKNCKEEDRLTLKKQYLQKLNSELSRNIYFDENEAKKIVQDLARL
ncbi:MAG: hypothetical protein U9R37_00845 [Campylobacterota bacterium]|nr:hypothetical protein [Campylobacterota bacterium]